jgi:hypothetical protein
MSFLSNREESVFRAWKKVPPELWSDPTIYDPKNYAKVYKKIQKKGLAAIGFDKIKLFEACLSLIEERDRTEDAHVGLVERVVSLLSEHNGVLRHYDAEKNTIYSIVIEDISSPSFYRRNSLNPYDKKLNEKTWRSNFSLSAETLSARNVFTVSGNSWQRMTHDYNHLGIYPEVQEYLIHKEKLQEIREKVRSLAEALPVLFETEESYLKIKPILIRHEERQFYLVGFDSRHNIILNYEAVSLCII